MVSVEWEIGVGDLRALQDLGGWSLRTFQTPCPRAVFAALAGPWGTQLLALAGSQARWRIWRLRPDLLWLNIWHLIINIWCYMPDASCLVPGAADNADADAVKVVKYVKLSKQCSWWTLAFEVHMWASWGSYFVKHERPELNNHLKRCQIPQITQQGWDMNTSNKYVKKLHDYQGVRARSYIKRWRTPGLIWKCSCS